MAFWAVEVKPGEPYVHESSRRGRLRITQATLGNLESVGWSTIECSVGSMMPVRLCALNSTSGMYRLDLEYDEEQNVVFSVIGDSSVHLAGYYKIPDAAANVQALVTQSQEADDCETTHVHGIARETTHVHGIAQEHNALDTEVHNDGTNQMVEQAGINAAANIDALVTQSQEDDDHETTHAHDIAQGHNALETKVHNDGPNQMVGQSGLNMKISDEVSLGSGHRPVYKEDVGGPIDELKIDELKSGDCNAEIASDGKEVEVKYIGMLKDGKVFDSSEGHPATFKFTLGAHKVIAGWEQGIQGMRVGGKRKLTIPPALAYKDKPQKKARPDEPQKETIPDEPQMEIIPANSWLVYEIELLRVSDPGEKKPKKKKSKRSRSVNRH
ncbi:peptidyl-prolyl cis-trans isomerase FKBP53-like isoform X2 [Miscanthus floridulus]|uniref:peptidyl-prolyl cis-trans isomerase FKBP53-like isoform X2 n=1 Tax=Miscanthus floridulus TaxID=154761 RepID=UPI0034594B95